MSDHGAPTRLYALPLAAHTALGVDVGSICWGSCGKGLVAGINLGEGRGDAIPCNRPAAECPAFDAEMPEPCGTVEYRDRQYEIVLRRIRQTPKGKP